MSTPDTTAPPNTADTNTAPPNTPHTTAPPSAPAASARRTAERLLGELRDEIARADTKASVLVAALGMTAGLFTGLVAGRNWSPSRLSGPGTVLWWAGAAGLTLSLLALLLAVLPRYRSGSWVAGRPLCYFGDIHQAVRAGRLAEALADTERDPDAGLLAALAENSRIAASKHRWIRTGLVAFCAGALLLPAAALIG
ncbi:Pycsar system effector family protein [Streptomyces puniciscabiei]|uniref:Pycsar system effector family protein n=1 Tax=Streptomyces puniciscabiei TaxID=164348 RepID=UPI0037B97D39